MSLDRAHDIEIVNSQGKKFGFMLAGEGGQKHYEVRDLSLLPPSLVTGEASYANMSPEQKILLEATDWRRGIQDEIYETAGRYYKASDCDLRFKGKAMLPPKELTALSYETYTKSITNAGLEDWDNDNQPTGWTNVLQGASSKIYKDEDEHAGTYAARLYAINSSFGIAEIYQDLDFDSASDRGRQFILKAYCKRGTRNTETDHTLKLGIEDKDGSVEWTSVTEATYTPKSVTKTLASDATRLRVRFRVEFNGGEVGKYANMLVDVVTISWTAPAKGSCPKIINFGSDLVVASNKVLYKLSEGELVIVKEFAQTITDLCVFENRLYIAQGWSVKYWYTSDLSTFTQCTLGNTTAKYMSNVGNSQFWISDTANTLRDSDNPIIGGTAFSTVYTLPNSAYDITGLVDDTSVVYARKEDQVYYLSGANVYSLIPDLVAEADTSKSYGIYPWKGKLYLPSGNNSLYEYDDGTVTILSPCRYAQGDTDLDGQILAIASDQEYLYIIVENGTKIEILSGHWEVIGGSTTWNWHWLYEKTSNDVTAALISAVTGSKRFYLGTNTASDGILNYKIPVSYSDPLKESSYEVQSSGNFITPKLTTNFATTDKLWPCIRVTSINFKDATTIKISYQKKGDTDWTVLGYCPQGDYTSVASPWSFTYPDETTEKFDIGVVSEWIRFKSELATSTDELSPIIKGYSVEGRLVPLMSGEFAGKVEIELTIKASANQQNLAGVSEPTTVASILKDIETLKQESLPFTITGPDQQTYTVRFSPRGSKRKPYIDEKGRPSEFWVTCLLGEV